MYRKKYKQQWTDYFIRIYGETIQCEICDKQIGFGYDYKQRDTVNFDHRTGNEPIQGRPTHWCRNRPCTSEHQKFWESCTFGLLCNRCNRFLKLENRHEFTKRLARYVGVIK